MNNGRYIEIDNYEREFWNLIESSIDLKLEGMSTTASSFINGPISFNARFPTKNRLLRDTSYFYSETNKLIHFTSVPVLFSIINEGSVRFYNLHNSNDKNEYTYASHKLEDIYKLQGINGENFNNLLNSIKEDSFVLSCTSQEGLYKSSFWNEYADNGKGVAIEFEIINDVSDWEFFYCSRIHYNKLAVFARLKEQWKELQLKNLQINYKISLNQILSLHKSKKWNKEDEIRILSLFPDLYQKLYNELVYRDFKLEKINFPIKYFKLPLCDKNGKYIDKNFENRSERFWSVIPRIRISDIYFGPDFPFKDNSFSKFQEELMYYISEKMNCWINTLSRNQIIIK